jgi:hypothetical protein
MCKTRNSERGSGASSPRINPGASAPKILVNFTDYEMWEFRLVGGFVGNHLAGTLTVLLDHPQGFGLAVGEASYVATRGALEEGR